MYFYVRCYDSLRNKGWIITKKQQTVIFNLDMELPGLTVDVLRFINNNINLPGCVLLENELIGADCFNGELMAIKKRVLYLINEYQNLNCVSIKQAGKSTKIRVHKPSDNNSNLIVIPQAHVYPKTFMKKLQSILPDWTAYERGFKIDCVLEPDAITELNHKINKFYKKYIRAHPMRYIFDDSLTNVSDYVTKA